MCQGSTQYFLKRGDKEITRSMYRYYLTHDPYCTKTAMQAFNEDEEFQQRGFHVAECAEKPDFTEPFGAILWHKRVNTGYPLCITSSLLGMSMENLIRLEMGWTLPEKEELEEILAGMAILYGFDPFQYFHLLNMGEEYRQQKPIDLSEYLGLDLDEATLNLMPKELRKQKPCLFIRTKIKVIGKMFTSGIEFPQRVIWSDGREFPIDQIDSAQERASFETGGTGTRFSCWLRGKHRNIGYEQPGDWFVETPCFA